MKLSWPCKGLAGGNITLRELALHLLDIIENAVRAQAGIVRVNVCLDANRHVLTLCVEDDGPGLPVSPDDALNPFFTTKAGKRTGLGLSLFRAAAQQAGGDMILAESEFGGAKVEARFEYDHLDRAPLGDLARTMKILAVSNPEVVWICHIEGPGGSQTLALHDVALEQPDASLCRVSELFAEGINTALQEARIKRE